MIENLKYFLKKLNMRKNKLILFLLVLALLLVVMRAYDALAPASNTQGIGSTLINPIDSTEMVYVPEGKFEMGSEDKQGAGQGLLCSSIESNLFKYIISYLGTRCYDEFPIHTVYLDAYWIYKYEVTNAEFAQFAHDTGYVTDTEKAGEAHVTKGSAHWTISGVYWNALEGPGSSIRG